MSTAITCPHCGAAQQGAAAGAFCESCGKALPSAAGAGPRIIGGAEIASTAAGQKLQSDELHKYLKRAATALLVVAILQTLLGPVMLWLEKTRMERNNPGMVYEVQPVGYAIVFGVAIAFWGLYFWARKQPLPAAIAGLALFVTLHLLDAIADPTMLARGILMKIIVIVVLIQAIKAGVKYRKLLQEQAAALPATPAVP